MHRRRLAAAASLVLVAVLLAACGDDGDADRAAPRPTTTTPTPTTTTTPPAAAVDWRARTVDADGVSESIDVAFCEGEAPFLCLSDAATGEHLGIVEHLDYPHTDADTGALDEWAHLHYESVALDRTTHCHPDYRLERDDPTRADVAGADGIRYGFTGTIDGRVVEQTIGYAAVVDGRMHLIVANALADDACLARETELPVAVMADVEPLLAGLAAGSVL